MRATFVTSGLETGGAESALLRLLPAMREFGIHSSVVSLRSVGSVGPLLQARSISVVALGMPALMSMTLGPRRLMREVGAWRPSLIHGWMYHGNLAASLVGNRTGLPVVWGIRQSLGLGTRDKWLTRRIIRIGALLSGRVASIVYNSAAARAQHERRGFARGHGAVLPNGFDTGQLRPDSALAEAVRDELNIRRGMPVIGHVARFHPAKDHAAFVRSAARVRERYPGAVFVMAGEGVDASNRDLASLIGRLRLTESVRLLGRCHDVARLMTAFDVLCLTSSGMEGFPNVIGEAMSCGVPCVGTAVGDVPEVIGDTGEVVPPDEPEAVAAAVARLLSLDPAARHSLGMRARQRIVERFSIDEVARRYADLLHAVVEQRH